MRALKSADVSPMNRVEDYLAATIRVHKRRLIGNSAVAASSCTIAAFAVGVPGALLVIVGTFLAMCTLIWCAVRRDRTRRRRNRSADVVAVARTSVRACELRRLAPDAAPGSRPHGRLVGDTEATRNALTWRPNKQFQKRGAQPVAISYAEITSWSASRMPGWIARVDLLHFFLTDGRDVLISATDPAELEAVLDAAGIPRIEEVAHPAATGVARP
jgi:hypothetical protein